MQLIERTRVIYPPIILVGTNQNHRCLSCLHHKPAWRSGSFINWFTLYRIYRKWLCILIIIFYFCALCLNISEKDIGRQQVKWNKKKSYYKAKKYRPTVYSCTKFSACSVEIRIILHIIPVLWGWLFNCYSQLITKKTA